MYAETPIIAHAINGVKVGVSFDIKMNIYTLLSVQRVLSFSRGAIELLMKVSVVFFPCGK